LIGLREHRQAEGKSISGVDRGVPATAGGDSRSRQKEIETNVGSQTDDGTFAAPWIMNAHTSPMPSDGTTENRLAQNSFPRAEAQEPKKKQIQLARPEQGCPGFSRRQDAERKYGVGDARMWGSKLRNHANQNSRILGARMRGPECRDPEHGR